MQREVSRFTWGMGWGGEPRSEGLTGAGISRMVGSRVSCDHCDRHEVGSLADWPRCLWDVDHSS